MSRLIVERGIAPCPGASIVVVPRRRRRGGWMPLEADAVVDAIEEAGPRALVAARAAGDDPGASLLPGVAALMGRRIVRLPAEPDVAAWVIAMAGAWLAEGEDICRALDVLAGAAACVAEPPRRGSGAASWLALRPRALVRWARRAWRPCLRCGAGGLVGAPCAGCGVRVVAA
ncbi:MAG: hypothetical protein AB7V42_14335 [Thermoleophilia bacterium]